MNARKVMCMMAGALVAIGSVGCAGGGGEGVDAATPGGDGSSKEVQTTPVATDADQSAEEACMVVVQALVQSETERRERYEASGSPTLGLDLDMFSGYSEALDRVIPRLGNAEVAQVATEFRDACTAGYDLTTKYLIEQDMTYMDEYNAAFETFQDANKALRELCI